MSEINFHQRYVNALERWPAAIRHELYRMPGDDEVACYGPGDHGHWAIQANNTAASAFAVLASDPELNESRAGMSRDEMLDSALRMIRFALRSHHAGGGAATDLQSWGHSWISALALERLMHGVEALGDKLPDQEQALLQHVLVSEANWLVDHYDIVAGLVENNKPESNIWNGCILHRTACMLPETPRCAEYRDKGTQFLLNGISTPADAFSQRMVAGRPLAAWHIGANMYDTMACNHHGYLNVGYMVICLSNIAMLHFSCRTQGWVPPEGLYHHARELWQLVKTCTFPDGRLWRIGGDTRVRYCYCQDYAIPTWLLARDLFGDHQVAEFEQGWLDQLAVEAEANPDDRFLSARLGQLEKVSPLYYHRLEGDRAATLSMGAFWHAFLTREVSIAQEMQTSSIPSTIPPLTAWSDEYHGSMLTRSARRLASWTWLAARPPQGMCLPADSTLAEWQGNLSGRILGMGLLNEHKSIARCHHNFPGGFATCGTVTVYSHQYISEGDSPGNVAFTDLACAALPDDCTMVVLQRARVEGRTYLRNVQGLMLQIPNDIFNGMRRVYRSSDDEFLVECFPGTDEVLEIQGNWLNVDNQLTVMKIYGPDLVIHRLAERNIFIKPYTHRPHTALAGGNLYVDEICCGYQDHGQMYDAGSILFDLGVAVMAGMDTPHTAQYAAAHAPGQLDLLAPGLRGVEIIGADDRHYLVIANFSDRCETESVSVRTDGHLQVYCGASITRSANDKVQITLQPGQVAVLHREIA